MYFLFCVINLNYLFSYLFGIEAICVKNYLKVVVTRRNLENDLLFIYDIKEYMQGIFEI